MADYIFSSGTCTKKEMYRRIIDLMVSAGWTDISTDPSDFNVMMSPGESLDKRLIVQFRPWNVNLSYNVETMNYGWASYRFIGDYTPGVPVQGVYDINFITTMAIDTISLPYSSTATGTTSWKDGPTLAMLINSHSTLGVKYTATSLSLNSIRLTQNVGYESPTVPIVVGSSTAMTVVAYGGIIQRPAESWQELVIFPASTNSTTVQDVQINYKYHANKNRLIVAMEYGGNSAEAVVLYIGIPDEVYSDEPTSIGTVYASSANSKGAGLVHISDVPKGVVSNLASITRAVYCQLSPKNPNTAGKYSISEVYYGNNIEGIRGKLTGLYVLPVQNIVNGDIIQIGIKQYYVVICKSNGNSTFPSNAIAFQIA